jgi:hypothetical protein
MEMMPRAAKLFDTIGVKVRKEKERKCRD